MYKFIFALIIFMFWAVFTRRYYVCEILGECDPPQTEVDSNYLKNIPKTLRLMAGDHVILEKYPQFYFDHCSHAYTYTDGNEKYLTKVASFLKKNPETKLIIRGYQSEKEKEVIDKKRFYNDLGLARSTAIIDKLVNEYNIPKSQIKGLSVTSKIEPLIEPLQFDITNYQPPVAKLNKADTAFLKQVTSSIKNVTFNDKSAKFEYNSDDFKPRASFDIYIDSLKNYLAVKPNDYLVIIGHTDSKGDANYNQKLGNKRAISVKKYLKSKGINVPIKTQSKGETDPLINDKNDDGSYDVDAMEQNRRVNVLIKTRD